MNRIAMPSPDKRGKSPAPTGEDQRLDRCVEFFALAADVRSYAGREWIIANEVLHFFDSGTEIAVMQVR